MPIVGKTAMTDHSTPQALQKTLQKKMSGVFEGIKTCVVMDLATWENVGIHALFLGGASYVLDELRAKIAYVSDMRSFSSLRLALLAPDAPIVLRAGTLTDGWAGTIESLEFCKRIIDEYKNRKVIILPRSISFAEPDRFEKMVETFNRHPDLTLFVRDKASHELAAKRLKCEVVLTPDIAFQLADKLRSISLTDQGDDVLFLKRTDWTPDPRFEPEDFDIPGLAVEDWKTPQARRLPWSLLGLDRVVPRIWSALPALPRSRLSRFVWKHPNALSMRGLARFRHSLVALESGIRQLQKHRLVITNRLHAHILCVLLGIPNVVLPGPHKNTDLIYETWTRQIPYCRFATSVAEVKKSIRELTEKYPKHLSL